MAMIFFFLALSLLLQGAIGELVCEDLPKGMCAYSVASSGKRCSLETGHRKGVFHCKTSEVLAHNNIHEHIESDDCIESCGADRNFIGISSDSLLDTSFTAKLCSEKCFSYCPNIVDIYSDLAVAEGGSLRDMCEHMKAASGVGSRRAMSQIKSSGLAFAPVSDIAEEPISDSAAVTASGPAGSESSMAPAASAIVDPPIASELPLPDAPAQPPMFFI